MEEYVAQCEKAIKTGKRTDLPKTLQTKLEENQRARENQALAKASSQEKAARTEPTSSSKISTTTIAKPSQLQEKGKESAPKEKEKKKTNNIKAKNHQMLWRFRQRKNRIQSRYLMRK